MHGPGQFWCIGCHPPPLSPVSTEDISFHPAGKALKRPRCGPNLLGLLLGSGWTWLAVDLFLALCLYMIIERIRVRTPLFTTAWVSCSVSEYGGLHTCSWACQSIVVYLWMFCTCFSGSNICMGTEERGRPPVGTVASAEIAIYPAVGMLWPARPSLYSIAEQYWVSDLHHALTYM